MVGIGINEGVILTSDTKVNDKGTLELVMKQAGMSEEDKVLASLNGTDVDDKSTKLLIFSPKLTNESTGVVKSQGQIMKEIQDFRKILTEFLLIYMTAEEVEAVFGATIPKTLSGIDNDTAFVNALKKDETVNKIMLGMITLFITVCKNNNIFDSKDTFRIKLWRQKKEKNFPKIPAGFSKWIEAMNVPVAKVVIEEFDKKPYDTTTTLCRISTAPADADKVTTEEADTTASMFNEQPTEGFVFPDDLSK